jgi:hypothetical protein
MGENRAVQADRLSLTGYRRPVIGVTSFAGRFPGPVFGFQWEKLAQFRSLSEIDSHERGISDLQAIAG